MRTPEPNKLITIKNKTTMKKIMLALAAALMLAACEKEEETARVGAEIVMPTDSVAPLVTIAFEIGGAIASEPMTRATTLAQSDMTDLWLFDYVGGACVNTIHLTPDDDGWSSPSASFTLGAHDIYFVASRGSGAVVDQDAGTIVWTTVRDTFRGHLSLVVTSGTAPSQSVTLDRATTRLRISVFDEVPAGMARLVVIPDMWYYGLNYVTGAAVSPSDGELGVNVPASYIGTTGQLMASFYSISGSSGWQTDVEVKAIDGNSAVIGRIVLTDAPFSRNVTTEYSGVLFSGQAAMSVALNDTWGDTNTQTW